MIPKKLFAVSVAFAFALASPICRSSAPAVSTENSGIRLATGDAEPGIILQRLKDGSTTIKVDRNVSSQLQNKLYFPSNARLIKLDSVYVKDKSIEELSNRLRGPAGTTVELILIEGNHEISRTVTRYTAAKLHEKSENNQTLFALESLFTNWHGSSDGYAGRGKYYHESANNIPAAAFFIAATTDQKFTIPALFDAPNKISAEALDFFIRTGMFDRFDSVADRCESLASAKAASRSDSDDEMLSECAKDLAENGCQERAKSIFDKLYGHLESLSVQNKMRVLAGRAELSQNIDGTNNNADYCKRLAQICEKAEDVPRDFLLDTLERFAAIAVKNKNFEIAANAQKHIVDLRRDTTGHFFHEQYQELVEALMKLAEIYELAGNSDKSRECLEEALGFYKNKLNAQEQIVLERSCFPCPSEVELRLAYAYAQSGIFDEASVHVALADKQVSEALGDGSNTAEMIKQIRKRLSEHQVETNHASSLKQFTDLFAVINKNKLDTDEAKFDEERQLARQAFDAASKNPKEAISLIDRLIQHEMLRSTHAPDDITRIINLIRAAEVPATSKAAVALLNKLNPIFEQAEVIRSSNKIYQQAELALLTDDHSTSNSSPKTSTTWANLENALKESERPPYEESERNKRDIEQRKFSRLINLSYFYAFLDEPRKARRIVEYARQAYPSVGELDLSPLAYEAILYVLDNNMNEAQKRIDLLLAPHDGFRYDYSTMLVVLSTTLYQTGHPDLSLKILDSDSTKTDAGSKRLLAYQRAIIKFKLGKFQDALSELGEDEHGLSLPSDQILNFRFLKATLLAKTGQTGAAISAYLKIGGTGRAQSLGFNEAVSLFKTIQPPPTNILKELVDGAQQLRGVTINKENVAAMKYISRLAREQKLASDTTASLDAKLAYLDPALGSADETLANLKNRAQTLEIKHNPGASYEWASLARSYFAQKKYAEGTEFMLHALRIDSAESFNHHMYHPGNLRGDLSFDLLLKAKRYDDAEKILLACIETHKTPGWSRAAYIEKSFLAELFLQQGKFDQASTWADALLATFTQDNGICPPRGGNMRGYLLFDTVNKFTAKKQFTTAQRLLDQATKTQLAVSGPKNELFIENYVAQATLLDAQNKLPEAEDFARKALVLEEWIGGSKNSGRICGTLLASILRRENKNNEADSIAVTTPRTETRPVDLVKLYNLKMFGFHTPLPELYAKTAEEPLNTALTEAINIHGEGNLAARKAMDDLSRYYVQQNRFDEAEKVQLRELKTLNDQFGKCVEPKFGCYLNLAEIYLLQNKMDKALWYVQQITATPQEEAIYDASKNELRLANVYLSTGKKETALELGRKVESYLLDAKSPHAVSNYVERLKLCLQFMQSAGALQDTDALQRRLNSLGR